MFVYKRFGYLSHRIGPSTGVFRLLSDTNKTNSSELLSALNNLTEWEPKYRHFLSSTQFLRLQQWKLDNGSLKAINDLLAINGFNPESIEKLNVLCDPASIPEYVVPDESQIPSEFMDAYTNQQIDYGFNPDLNKESAVIENTDLLEEKSWYTKRIEKGANKKKLAIEPKRVKFDPNTIQTFTSINQSLNGVNWTKFSRYNSSSWIKGVRIDGGFIQDAMPVLTENHICEQIVNLAPIVNQIPVSDVYVLETDTKLNLNTSRNGKTPKAVVEVLQLNQLNTILTTILTVRTTTKFGTIGNLNVYFIGPSMLGSFFGLRLGKETVSTQPTVKDILKLNKSQMEKDGFVIDVPKDWKDLYFNSRGVKKEGLCKSLLLGLTFVHLGLHKM